MNTKKLKHFTDSIYYDIEQIARLMKFLGTQVFKKLNLGMNMEEHIALDTISCHSGICQRDLAKMIIKDRANTGKVLNSLEGKKLITRFVDVKNNRLVKKIAITEEGYKKLEEVNIKIKEHFDSASQRLSEEEIENLQMQLRMFRAKLEECVKTNI